jgi:hypothetical protein
MVSHSTNVKNNTRIISIMKLPSIFRTATHARFEIKPRYYDPVKEEIEQRTSRIKHELRNQGMIDSDTEDSHTYGSSLRGAFTQGSPIRGRSSSGSSAGMLRLGIIVILVAALTGYYYFGNEVLYGFAILGGGIMLVNYLRKLKSQTRK